MTEIAELTMSYEGLVEAGRAAREQGDNVQWTEGDLALQVDGLPIDARPRDPETWLFIEDEAKALKRYAEDVGVAYATLKRYRQVASAWPKSTRSTSTPWHVHRALVAQEDRFDLIRPGMTVREAEKIVRDRTKGAKGKPSWLELAGRVGDDLKRASKHFDRLEAEVDRQPNQRMQTKLAEYAQSARSFADRLDALREWHE